MTQDSKPLLHHFRTLFSFSKSKDDRQYSLLEQVNRTSFFEDEKVKVKEIKNLINNGEHNAALNELLSDFASNDGIQYFNKVRYLEGHGKSNPKFNDEKKVNGVVSRFQLITPFDLQSMVSIHFCMKIGCHSGHMSQAKQMNIRTFVVGKASLQPTDLSDVQTKSLFIHGKALSMYVVRKKG